MRFWDRFDSRHLVAAHRGFRAIRAENTMVAFQAAIGKCDFIELDVGFSRDGIPIIIHDDTLERTSNVTEMTGFTAPYNVIDYSYEKLLTLDFSSWFIEKDPFATIAAGTVEKRYLESLPIERLLTLEEILIYCKEHKVSVNVEIKDMRGSRFDTTAVSKVLSIIQILQMEDSVLLSSFNHQYISQVKELLPQISISALQEHAHPENLVNYLRALDVRCYHSDIKIITPELVAELSKAGIMVNVYTVNSAEEKARMFAYGVRSIFTDFL